VSEQTLTVEQQQVQRLLARVAAKDAEFAKERAAWKRQDAERVTRIKHLEREVRELKKGFEQ
jgi:hypothetical protein